MAYIRPSVRVYQDFLTFSPAISTPDLDACIVGPCYQFLDFSDALDKILADTKLTYTGAELADVAYPAKYPGAEVIPAETAVIFDDAKLLMYATDDTNSCTVTAAKPEEVRSSTDNFATIYTRGVRPGDVVTLKKDAVVGAFAKLLNQGVTFEYRVKGAAGNSVKVTLVDDSGATHPKTTFALVGDDLEITLQRDPFDLLATANSLVADFADAPAEVRNKFYVTGTGAVALTPLAATNLSGGVDQVDGDTFSSTVMRLKTVGNANDTIVLAENAPADFQIPGLDIEVVISENGVSIAPSEFTSEYFSVGVGAGVDVNIEGVASGTTPIDMQVLSAKVYVTYRALRKDLAAEITDLYSTNEVLGTLGKIDTRNPLALGVFKALQNTNTRVRCIGIGRDDEVGYQQGLDVASTVDTVYALVPLTQNPVVCAAFSTHCQQFSTPDEGKWRICLVNTALITEKYLTSQATPPSATVTDEGGKFIRVEDLSGTFVGSGVVPGDTFSIGGEDYVVNEVINNNILLLVSGPDAEISVHTDYSITRDLSKTQQAENTGIIAGSFGSRRTYYVWPDIVGNGGEYMEGYYLCAAVAGMAAGFPAHKGFTNVGIVGFDDVGRSNRYFNEPQLNTMAEKGVYIVVQDAPGAIPYSRHQVSTDPDIIEFRELSITKNIDFLSYFFKRRLATFIGDWNITPNTLLAIQQFTQGLIDFLTSQSTEKIGAPLLSGTISLLQQHPTLKDNVDMYIDIEIPYPLNNLNLHLVV